MYNPNAVGTNIIDRESVEDLSVNCPNEPALVEEESDGGSGSMREPQAFDQGQVSDHSLIAEFQATGSERAFQGLHDRYKGAVQRVCAGVLKDRGRSEDFAQETFLRVFQKGGSLAAQSLSRAGY